MTELVKERTKRKKLTREEYLEKFHRLYTPQVRDGVTEELIQCQSPDPDYWFVSSFGYVLSVAGKHVKKIKQNWRPAGKRSKDGSYPSQNWYYVYRDESGEWHKPMTHVFHAKYFKKCEFDLEDDEKVDVHHIKARSEFTPEQGEECNRPDNLQVLPKERIHQQLGKYTSPHYEKNSEKETIKALEKGTAQMTITDQLTPEFVKALLQGTTWESGSAFYLKNLSTNETLAFPVPKHVAGDPLPDILKWKTETEK